MVIKMFTLEILSRRDVISFQLILWNVPGNAAVTLTLRRSQKESFGCAAGSDSLAIAARSALRKARENPRPAEHVYESLAARHFLDNAEHGG
jgi:hypothetical protein